MENTDSYPVFHTRREATMRRRGAGGVDREASFLVLNAAKRLVDRASVVFGDLAVHDVVRPSIPVQLRRSPGACCPVPGCSHRHDGDDPPQAAATF